MGSQKINIAIDGYSSCGKSTLAKALARKLNFLYIDTGAMYRAFTLFTLQKNINDLTDLEAIERLLGDIVLEFKIDPITGNSEMYMNGKNVEKEIREMRISERVSPVSAIKMVREKLVQMQQNFGKTGGIVMEGRDIGTVVLPDAELKIFMTADPEVRAKRRFEELKSKGIAVSLEEVRNNLVTRDYQDTHREVSPLSQANDAIVLDNTALTQEQQLDFVLDLVSKISV